MKTGIFPNIEMSAYLAMPAVSSSVLLAMLNECPKAAWWQSWLNPARVADVSTDAQDAGSIAHSILLEGHSEGVEVINPEDYPAEKTGNVPDGWTNKAIRAARDAARAVGKIPVLKADMAAINAMVVSARKFIEECRATEPAIWSIFQPGGGESELTCVWDDDGIPCRIRPDRISRDRRLIVDVKTSNRSAEPDSWGRSQLAGMDYYVSASFYRRGIEKIADVSPAYTYLVIEQEAPHLCSLVGMSPHHFALGEDKVRTALDYWRLCFERNSWPGYAARVAYPDLPAWTDTQWMEKRERESQDGGDDGHYEKLFGGMKHVQSDD